jgi:signal transduction histidine kinase
MEKNLSDFREAKFNIRLNLKTKIWMTVLSVVLMFAFFILFYFPAVQQKYILKNYNNEIQNLANTVSLGVKIALKEQNFEGVQTAIDFVKKDPHLEFVSLVQMDTVWNSGHTGFKIERKIFKTYPENVKVSTHAQSDEFQIVKRSPFATPLMNGEIMLGFNTLEIAKNKRQILVTSLIVSSIVFVIGILMGFVLARNISEPVLKLRDAANRVSEGDLTQRVNNRSKDEIGELSLAFNKMVSDLGIARKEIEQRSLDLMNKQEEITTQRDQLKDAIDELKATQQHLIQSEKMASLGELTAGIAHEIQNPLNFVNNFSEVNSELIDEMKDEIVKGNISEVMAIAGDIKENELKINMHGRRADSIVKGMLEHSRSGTGKKEPTDINVLAEEFMRLAYHGLRAKDKAFNSNIEIKLDNNLPKINMIPQDFSRIMLNLFNNSFYAVNQKLKTTGADYKPEVTLTTSAENGKAVIRVKDNGTGIPDAIKEKIMQPFFTTKPTGEGTGLGLSLIYDIIVKGYGGSIDVNSIEGEGAEFVISILL